MFKTGMIVKSTRGHDKDAFYCIVGAIQGHILIADGKARKLAKPKRKNEKHLAPTKSSLDLAVIVTDKKLRQALAAFTAAENAEGGY